MNYEIEHACYQLKGGRWIAQFHLNHLEGATLYSQQCFDPRTDLSFATEEEAKERNRELARNWRNVECPGVDLFERRAELN